MQNPISSTSNTDNPKKINGILKLKTSAKANYLKKNPLC